MEKLSVVLALYNCEKYIEKCLTSLLNQTYKNIEIIVVNDGSTDSSFDIVSKYQKIDKRVKLYSNKNMGVSYSRNFGISKCTGKYLTFVDSDDFLDEDMYEKMVNNLILTNSDISIVSYYEEFENSNTIFKSSKENELKIYNQNEFISQILSKNGFKGFVWNKLYKRDKIKTLFDENISICEDLLFNIENAFNINKVVYSTEKKYHYIQRNNSAMHSKLNMKEATMIVAYDKINNKINNLKISNYDIFEKNMLFAALKSNIILKENLDKCTNRERKLIELSEEIIKKSKKNVLKNSSFKEKIKVFVFLRLKKIYILFRKVRKTV